ncbi:unnamed protein product, partial [Anisakis simplex]|uniref:DUF569 domain-containing protein n=1 Tax=Anisakis simplex TaxID=6269 RepID=A0A0M3JCZ3_ANISI
MTRRPYLLDYMEEEGEAREWRVEITAIWNGFTTSQMVTIRFDDGNEFAGNDGSVGERERNFERFFEFDLPEDPGNPPLPAAAGKTSQVEHGDLVSQPGSSRGRFVGIVRMEEASNRILRTTNGEQRAADLPGNSGGQNSRELEWEYQIEPSEWSQAFEIDTRTGTLKTAAGRRRWIDFEEVQHIVLVVIATRHSNRTQSTDPTMKSLRVSSKSEQKSQTPEANRARARARARARSATSTRTAAIRRRICVHLQILDVNDNRPKFVV